MDGFGNHKPVDVEAGEGFSMAIDDAGRVYTWGYNGEGNLGEFSNVGNRLFPSRIYHDEYLLHTQIVQVSAGTHHAIALTADGKIYTWGHNAYGNLGLGHGTKMYRPQEVNLTALGVETDIIHVAAGRDHTLFVTGNLTKCYGKVGVLACNHPRGECIAEDTCKCVQGYSGAECEKIDYTCYGYNYESACNRLNGGGKCNGPNKCDCADGYSGQQCQDFSCYGKSYTDACSYPNGTCVSPNNCSCADGYTGDQCEKIVCFGKETPNACNNPYGSCVSPDQCLCYGYGGKECEYKITVYAAGLNDNYHLGVSSTAGNIPTFTAITSAISAQTVVAIGATRFAGWVYTKEGNMYGWGLRQYYEHCGPYSSGYHSTRIQYPLLSDCLNGHQFPSFRRVKQFSTGYLGNCALSTDGKVFCWGRGSNGEVGNGGTGDARSAVQVGGGIASKVIVQLATGHHFTIALSNEGLMYSWGYNGHLGLGRDVASNNNRSPQPVDVSTALKNKFVVKVAAKHTHVLALTNDNLIVGWGTNEYGQIGDGTTTSRAKAVFVDMSPFEGKRIIEIEVGHYVSFAITKDGQIFSWGRGDGGRRGDMTLNTKYIPSPIYMGDVLLGKTIAKISSDVHTLLLSTEGKVYAWGENEQYGNLGVGYYVNQLKAIEIDLSKLNPPATNISDIVASHFTSFLVSGMMPSCFGKYGIQACNYPFGRCVAENQCECFNTGYIGDECETLVYTCYGKTPDEACGYKEGRGFCVRPDICECNDGWSGSECEVHICYGKSQSVACSYPNGTCIDANTCECKDYYTGTECEQVVCYNKTGEDACNYPNGVCIAPNTCYCFGHLGDECDYPNQVYAAGLGTSGQLGNSESSTKNVFVKVTTTGALASVNVTAVFATRVTTFAISNEGNLYGWGYNGGYELYDETSSNKNSPIACRMDSSFYTRKIKKIASSTTNTHIMALTTDGTVFAWGKNLQGQLGDQTYIDKQIPVLVTGMIEFDTIIDIAVGDAVSFAVTDKGKVFSWGKGDSGALGTNSTENAWTPLPVYSEGVLNGKYVVKISCKNNHVLVLTNDRKIYAWGDNTNGKLGDGTTTTRWIPVAVIMDQELSGRKVVDVEAGGVFSMALTDDSTVWTWGSNEYYSLGDYTDVHRYTPHRVFSDELLQFKVIVQIAAGHEHAMILTEDGKVYAWGRNNNGQLGIGNTASQYKPVEINLSSIGRVAYISAGGSHSVFVTGDPITCFNKTGALACSYPNGECIGMDTCKCTPFYEGKECEIAKFNCFGKPFNESCNYPIGGVCIAQDYCECRNKYVGKECMEHTCFGKSGNQTCSGRGVCYTIDICLCYEGYTGNECQTPKCFGKTLRDACNYPNGICVEKDVCSCNGYTGEMCDAPLCFGKTGTNACNYPRGTCVGPNQCVCQDGYAGAECEEIGCFGKPRHLACNAPYGNCTGPDFCTCSEGYGQPECSPICFNKTGDEACSGNGVCVLPDVCDCSTGWSGFRCDNPVCFGRPAGPGTCSGHGQCLSPNQCLCDYGYFGYDCSSSITSSVKEISVETTLIDIYGNGFSSTITENSVELKVGMFTPTCSLRYASMTRLQCSVTGLSIGPLYAIVSVKGFSSQPTQIATVVGNITIEQSAMMIPGYAETITINGDGFSENVNEMEVELSQAFNTPICTIISLSKTQIVCNVTGITNGVIYARVLRNNIPSQLVQIGVIDSTKPVAGYVKILAEYSTSDGYHAQESTSVLKATWLEFYDEGCGIDHFEIAVFEEDEVLRPFYSVGFINNIEIDDISLVVGKQYSIHVRAFDKFGYMSDEVSSEKVSIITKPIIPIVFPSVGYKTVTVNLPLFPIVFAIPTGVYDNPAYDHLNLEPIKSYSGELVDPIESVPRMIGFVLTNPHTTLPFNKPIHISITYSVVNHLVPIYHELKLKYYDKTEGVWKNTIDTCTGYEGATETTDTTNKIHTSCLCQMKHSTTQIALF
jgi:alpha-tubulin suppressor-like RCC1 family protein